MHVCLVVGMLYHEVVKVISIFPCHSKWYGI